MCDEGRGEKGRENSIFITQQQLVHEGFVSSTDCTSPLHSRKIDFSPHRIFQSHGRVKLFWDYASEDQASTKISRNYTGTQHDIFELLLFEQI